MIKVLVAGAAGRMGQESCRAVYQSDNLMLAGAVDIGKDGENLGKIIGIEDLPLTIFGDLNEAFQSVKPDVYIDFTSPDVVFNNAQMAISQNIRPIIGTTGLSREEITTLTSLCEEKKLGGLIAPNFAIGALLMIKFSALAAKYMPQVEIIELHHDKKKDAPSGTALKTAEAITEVRGNLRQGLPTEFEKIQGVRGGNFEGMRIHSVRLPGYVAHQEVIFGSIGQTLTIRHDSISRESFMPGVIMGIHKVMGINQLVYGLENLIFE